MNLKFRSILLLCLVPAGLLSSKMTAYATMSLSWTNAFDGTNLVNDAFIASPALGANGTLYIAGALPDPENGNKRRLYAINGSTGAILSGWPVFLGARINPSASGRTPDKGAESSPAIGPDGMIYIGSWNYSVYKINPSTRSVTSWTPGGTQPKGVLRTAPIIQDSYLYCWMDGDPLVDPALQQPHLVILNASTMAFVKAWVPSNGVLGDAIASPALGRNKIIYAATHHLSGSDKMGHVYAIDVSTVTAPSLLWTYPPDCIGSVVSSPIIDADGKLYIATQQGSLGGSLQQGAIICFNPKLTAPWDPIWFCEVTSNRPVDGTPAIASDGSIAVPIDAIVGAESSFATFNPQIQVDVPNQNDSIIYDWGSNLSGAEKFDSSPVLGADGSIFVKSVNDLTSAAKLYHLSPVDGTVSDQFSIGNETVAWHSEASANGINAVFSSPVIAPDGNVYVATAGNESSGVPTGGGRIVCFTTGLSGYSFWPSFRGNTRNTGNVQDNNWTLSSAPSATITALYSYPVSGFGEGLALNIAGKAIGYVPHSPSNGKFDACYWTIGSSQFPSHMTSFGGFGSSYTYVANGINDASNVVGSQVIDSLGTLRAIHWSSLTATPTELTRPPSYSQAEAIEISRSGMIVGNAKNPSGLWRAMRWDGSASAGVDLGTLGFVAGLQSYGYGNRARIVGNTTIAANGSIVGKSQSIANGLYHAFLTPWNALIDPTTDNLSGNDQSEAHAINGLGQVVGSSANGATPEHAWIWIKNPDGTISSLDLGTLAGGSYSSRAMAINDRGQVVGWAYNSTGTLAAFVWVPGWSSMKELRTLLSPSDASSWPLLSVAYGISNDGTVVGYGYQNGSTNRTAFAIKPN